MKSGLQKQVVSLYRNLLRVTRLQEVPSVRFSLREFFKKEFKRKSTEIGAKDIQAIEHEMRIEKKKLEFFKEHTKIKRISF